MKDPVQELLYKLPKPVRPVIVIIGGMLIQLTLGSVYTFGNIVPYIVSYMRVHVDPTLTVKSMLFIVSFEGGFPGSYLLGGLLERKLGPRKAALIGSVLVSAGMMLSYFAVQNSFIAMLFTMGVGFGLGTGTAYNAALVCAMKWLPHNVGLASGLIVAGYGCGAFVFSPIESEYINPWNYEPDEDGYFSQPELLERVPKMFLILGVIFLAMELVGCIVLCPPKEDDIDPDEIIPTDTEEKPSLTPKQMLASTTCYLLFFSYLFNTAVTTVPAYYKAFGETFIDDDIFLAWVASASSIFNAAGRIVWGIIADKTSYQTAMCMASAFMSILLFTFISTELGGKIHFITWVCLILGCYSANFSLFPLATSKCFGPKYVGINYGLIIISQFIAGITMSTIADELLTRIGFVGFWFICGTTTFITFLLTTTIQKTKYGKGLEHFAQNELLKTESIEQLVTKF